MNYPLTQAWPPGEMTPIDFLTLSIAWGEWRQLAMQRYGFRKVFSRFFNPFTNCIEIWIP